MFTSKENKMASVLVNNERNCMYQKQTCVDLIYGDRERTSVFLFLILFPRSTILKERNIYLV